MRQNFLHRQSKHFIVINFTFIKYHRGGNKGKERKIFVSLFAIISVVLYILLGGHHLIFVVTSTNGNITLHWMDAIEVLFIGGGAGNFALIKWN